MNWSKRSVLLVLNLAIVAGGVGMAVVAFILSTYAPWWSWFLTLPALLAIHKSCFAWCFKHWFIPEAERNKKRARHD